MKFALITKSTKKISLILYDEKLSKLIEESFEDLYTLNFYLQTIPKKFGQEKTLLIYNDLKKIHLQKNTIEENNEKISNGNSIQLIVAQDENSYFIQE